MNNPQQLILLASERSGTNLLRAILCNHSAIASPPPSGMIDALGDKYYRYLSPLKTTHLPELIEDVITLTRTHINPWDMGLSPEMIDAALEDKSFWGLFKTVNDLYAAQLEKPHWLSKEPGLFRHIFEIKTHLPHAKFIYLARDGRDVAASMLKGGVHEGHIYTAAELWAKEQRLCLNALCDPAFKDQIMILKYEDLIGNAQAATEGLMRFIGLEFEPAQLEYYKNPSIIQHSKQSTFWTNVSKPVDASNKGNFKNSLTASQIAIFESVAWHEMTALGYPLENKQQKHFSLLERGFYKLSSAIRRKLKTLDTQDETKRRAERVKIVSRIQNRSFND